MTDLVELANQVQLAAEAVASGTVTGNLELLKAIRNLHRVAEPPSDRLIRLARLPMQIGALRLAIEIGLPQALVAAEEMTATELAAKCKADTLLVVRVMRALVAMDLVDETGEEQYKSNASTEALASATWTGSIKFLYETLVPGLTRLVDCYHETGFSTNEKSLFEYALKQDLWAYLREHPSVHNDFLVYMQGRNDGNPRWLDYFPASTQVADLSPALDAVTIVDVGGNLGHDLKLFQQRYPEIRGRLVLMDLPEVVAANSDSLEGIEQLPYDFFQPQTVLGAKFYMFRRICHDWPDADCIKFLGNTVKAMKPGYSRLLINEQVLPNTGAELIPAVLDLTMMAYFNAMERTERQWRVLLDAVGVDVVKIWRFEGGGTEAVIEAVVRE